MSQEDFQQQLKDFEGERTMAYLSSIERSGIERGRQEGRQEGLQEGRQEGLQEGRQEMILELLRDKFGDLPDAVPAQVAQLNLDQLRALGKALLGFDAVKDLIQWLDR
jgi:predicted transposase YdaD